jgi:protein TonB
METKKTSKANLENKKILFREIGLIIALLLAIMSFEWKTYDKTISFTTNERPVDIDESIPVTIPEPPQPEPLKAPEITDIITIVDDKIDIPLPTVSTEDNNKWGVKITEYLPKPIEEEPVDEGEIPVVLADGNFSVTTSSCENVHILRILSSDIEY